MYKRKVIDLEDALRLIEGVFRVGPRETDAPLAVSVVDENGDWVAFARMDKTPPFNQAHAHRKVYTASIMRSDLRDFAASRAKSGRLLADLADRSFIGSAHGGLVLRDDSGSVLGAIGVSGATSDEDERIARTAVAEAPLVFTEGN